MRFRAALVFLSVPCCLMSQNQATTVQAAGRDINGNRVPGPTTSEVRSADSSRRTEYTPSVNGRLVRREQIEERVVSRDGRTTVTEQVIRRFDQNGNPGPIEKRQIRETKNPDGSSQREASVSRADVNGNLRVVERSITDERKTGSVTEAQTRVERSTLNGGLEEVEHQLVQTRQLAPNRTEETATTLRKDTNGRLAEAARRVTDRVETAGKVEENSAVYDSASSGQLQLASQSVTTTVKNADGSATTQTNVYGLTSPGRAGDTGKPQLREQQVVEKRKAADGSVVESVVVRRANASDPNRLEAPITIAERVCQGKCDSK